MCNPEKKVYARETVAPTLHVIRCPDCGRVLASASDRAWLPSWSTCDELVTRTQRLRILPFHYPLS